MISTALMQVERELTRAREMHPRPMRSAHEVWGVVREEYLEMEAEIARKTLDRNALREELVQLAAVAIRAIEDLGLVATAADHAA